MLKEFLKRLGPLEYAIKNYRDNTIPKVLRRFKKFGPSYTSNRFYWNQTANDLFQSNYMLLATMEQIKLTPI